VGTLIDAAAATTASEKYAARGLDDCNDRVIAMTPGKVKKYLFMTGNDESGRKPAPAPVQFLVEVPAGGAASITFDADMAQVSAGFGGGGASTASFELLAKPGADAIRWTYTGQTSTNDSTLQGTVSCTGGTSISDPGSCTGKVDGPFAAGPVVLQLQASGTGATIGNLSLATEGEGPSPTEPDAGPSDDNSGDGDDNPGDGGCGCTTGGQNDSPLAGLAILGGLALFGFGITRRRR
jgi:MYXO-CTERM domain-containing protein